MGESRDSFGLLILIVGESDFKHILNFEKIYGKIVKWIDYYFDEGNYPNEWWNYHILCKR